MPGTFLGLLHFHRQGARPIPRAAAPPDDRQIFHSRAWVLWLLAALVPSLLTKNPFYLGALLVILSFTHRRLQGLTGVSSDGFAGWGALLRLGLVLAALAAVITPLFVRAGETPLFHLPSPELPWSAGPGAESAFGLGGTVTLESVVYGLSTALGLMAILLTFAVFHAAADPYQLLRSLPRFLVRSGVVLSIAVTFVPQMMVAQQEIREAQALRGHRFRGLRDLAPLFVTLLSEGLERSITLAESLEVRGFSRTAERPPKTATLALGSSLLILVLGAAGRTWKPESAWGDALLVAGGGLLVLALVILGHRVRRTRLRPQVWRRRDTAVTVASLLSLGFLAYLWLSRQGGLAYYPYPLATRPALAPPVLVALLLLAAPALARPGGPRSTAGRGPQDRGAGG